mmetsp:Transcript_2875/g.6079  ORF Transcript_2875/g.6079 Transcript_2875/m.6079 type:complete len:114 (+) Transcript_2875:753-1094(+)
MVSTHEIYLVFIVEEFLLHAVVESRPSTCKISQLLHAGKSGFRQPGHDGTTPKLGLNPTTAHSAAGRRTDPPPSLPTAMDPIPDATAAAAPPLDPPQFRSRFQGFLVVSNKLL